MSKSKLIIIIILILSMAVGVIFGLYLYIKKSTTNTPNTTINTDNNIFGGIGGVRNDLPKDTTNSTGDQIPETSKPTPTSTPQIPPLRMIASGPISGADFVIRDIYSTTTPTTGTSSKNNKQQTLKPKLLGQEEKIRYIERGTGRVYESSPSLLKNIRISNSTLTRLTESFFDTRGDNIILRGLLKNSDIIQTRLGTIQLKTPTSTEPSLKTRDLQYNMLSVALSPEKDSLLYYVEQKNIGSSINISKIDGTSIVSIYKSPLREWLLSWPNKDSVVINTKPSAYSKGFAYLINPKTKSFKRIVGEKPGMTTLMSPDGQKILVGESVDGSFSLSVLDLKTSVLRSLYLKAIPEKCVWSKLEKPVIYCAASEEITYAPYPDAWYQGLVFFNDNIWKINTETLENKLVVSVGDFVKSGVDITNPILNKKEDYLIFTNKKDLSLWGLEIQKPKATSTPVTKTTVQNSSKIIKK